MLDDVSRKKIRQLLSGEVLFDEPLCRHISFGVGGRADAVVFPQGSEELRQIVGYLGSAAVPFLPMGNGTNLIVRDGGYRGVVVSLKGFRGLQMKESGGAVLMHAEAGVTLAEAVSLSVESGIGGMEFCAGIPGSVGGAVVMNAGAYGRQMQDVVEEIVFMEREGEIRTWKRESLRFDYRSLVLPRGSLVMSADFSLARGDKDDVRKRVAQIMARRRERHPLRYRNAGSIFKNPAGLFAGKIIEELGLKGLRKGDAQISELHGNFIVNLGGAKAADIIALIDNVKERVFEERGVALETEVCIIGEEG